MKYRDKVSGLKSQPQRSSGFALVSTLMLMILLSVLAVGMLSLSAVSLRTSSLNDAMTEARANAKIALMIAIGELQVEMGPDMRVGAKAAIFDQNPATEEIEGVDQSHWLASYESWGNWLNGSYINPASGENLNHIRDTYTPKREKMFRRWLLSLPDGMAKNINAPVNPNGWDDSNSLVLVGKGSAASQDTRAYLNKVGETGRSAWWIGPENHKARLNMAKNPRDLSAGKWEFAQGDTAEVGAGALTGLGALDTDASLGEKIISQQSLGAAGVDKEIARKYFFDLTDSSRGVLASVRTGHLKKDLSLLFEGKKADLPNTYRFDPGDVREPSIRPMSSEISGKPVLPGRHFASWTRMRHFYRMYRQDADALAPPSNMVARNGGTDGSPGLVWVGGKPVADCNVSNYVHPNSGSIVPSWDHQDSYIRFPILTSATYILSLRTLRTTRTTLPYDLHSLSTPVYVFWNPYNVELRLPNTKLWVDLDFKTVQPMLGRVIRNSISGNGNFLNSGQNAGGLADGNGAFIIFKPGQFRVFTASPGFSTSREGYLEPGFDARNVGGMQYSVGTSSGPPDNPTFGINFSPVGQLLPNILFNTRFGNTPGSFCTIMRWSEDPSGFTANSMSLHNHVDWLNTGNEQAFAPITRLGSEPGWIYDGQPYHVGYIQLALKSNFSSKDEGWYDSIGWSQDWRCRNWIQAPPFSLGKGLYLNENDATIANTQRMDCPYEFRFGSLLGKDPGDIIPHDPFSNSAFLSQHERVNAVPALELPTAPIASIAGFAGMWSEPGWTDLKTINPNWEYKGGDAGQNNTTGNTNRFGSTKVLAYQSGVTGPGIGNSFLHPIIARTDVYRKFDNSTAKEPINYPAIPTTGLPYPYRPFAKNSCRYSE